MASHARSRTTSLWYGKQLRLLWKTSTNLDTQVSDEMSRRGPMVQVSSLGRTGRRCLATGSGGKDGDESQRGKDGGQQKLKAGPGFFETFRKSVVEQFSRRSAEDEKVKQSLERLQQARQEAEEAARRSLEVAQKAAEEAKKRAEQVEKETRPTRDKIGEHVGGVVGGIAKRVVENPLVKGTAEIGMKAAETILDAPDVIDRKTQELEAKIAASKVGQKVKEFVGGDSNVGPVAGKDIDTESMGLMLREETRWDKTMRRLKDNSILGPLISGTEEAFTAANEASNRLGDRLFETETSICMSEIKREEPNFSVNRFLNRLKDQEIPLVLSSTLQNKVTPIMDICTERMIAYFSAEIQGRLQKGHIIDPTIMDIDDVELEKAFIWDGEPVLVITFLAQQVNCVRDKSGAVIVGGESELRQVRYRWLMTRIPPKDGKGLPSWRLHEMAKAYESPLIA